LRVMHLRACSPTWQASSPATPAGELPCRAAPLSSEKWRHLTRHPITQHPHPSSIPQASHPAVHCAPMAAPWALVSSLLYAVLLCTAADRCSFGNMLVCRTCTHDPLYTALHRSAALPNAKCVHNDPFPPAIPAVRCRVPGALVDCTALTCAP
jgi:hypothetical protein